MFVIGTQRMAILCHVQIRSSVCRSTPVIWLPGSSLSLRLCATELMIILAADNTFMKQRACLMLSSLLALSASLRTEEALTMGLCSMVFPDTVQLANAFGRLWNCRAKGILPRRKRCCRRAVGSVG